MRTAADFIRDELVNPETGQPFELTPAEVAFLDHAFELNDAGRLRYPELLFGAIKKSGKTAFAAMILLYVVLVLGGSYAEGYVIANDFEQAQGRVFQATRRIVEASPHLRADAKITADKITFQETAATIQAIASDYASAAGANPVISVFDELWAYTSERSRRLWDEMVPPPTRRIACRLTVTYAGFEGESELLSELHRKGMNLPRAGDDLHAGDGLLMFWSHVPIAPWQTPEWLTQMRQQLRPNAYLRMIENRWVTSESTFVDMDEWDACVDPALTPVSSNWRMPIWIGVDASVKRDSTAIVAVTWANKKARLVWHKIFQPSPDEPLDFEATVEETVLSLRRRFAIREVRFDPYQMQASAQRLTRRGVRMVEYPQTVPGLTASSTALYELIRSRDLRVYPDDQIRLAISRAVAIEGPRGWRIAKERQSHKIDVVVAMAMAVVAAVQHSERRPAVGSSTPYRTNRGTINGVGYGGEMETVELIRQLTRH